MFNGQIYYGERGYLQLMADILNKGVDVPDRTGVGSRALFDAKIVYQADESPFSTVRPLSPKKAFDEFWFFMSGRTQTKALEAKGVNFWKANTSREFLDNRGLNHLEEGDMGLAYGAQFRHFNKGLGIEDKRVVDQLRQTYEILKTDPYSRRLYTTFWNPSASPLMALTPCWHSHQFVVLPNEEGKNVLHMKMLNRSLDACYGFQFAVIQYRIYQMCLAKLLGFEMGTMVCDLNQTHLYANQLEYSREILTRDFGTQGKMTINKELHTLEDMINLEWSDLDITGLEVNRTPFKTPAPPVAA
jgi:thymidylate synthase